MNNANTCPCGKTIERDRHVCKSCWDVAPSALKTNYTFWQSRPDSALCRRATQELIDFCSEYAKDYKSYSIELPSGLVGKLSNEEQAHAARLLERRAHLRAILHASPAFNPFYQAEAQAIEWAIRKIEQLVRRLGSDRQSLDSRQPPVQPPIKTFAPPASIEEGERLREELAIIARQMSQQGGKSEYKEISAQLRELKAWLHTQRQQRRSRLIEKAFGLLSEAIAADGEEALIVLFGDAKGIRQAFHQMAEEFFAQPASTKADEIVTLAAKEAA